MNPEVVTVGLGYIGLPTSALIASCGTNVLGVDVNQKVVDIINQGKIGESYCIGGNSEFANIDLFKKIHFIMKSDLGLEILPLNESYNFIEDRLGHDFRYSLDSSKINDVGWKANYDFDKSLEQTIIWYLNNKEFLN